MDRDKQIVIDNKIFIIRGIQVMIDKDLAELYQVETKVFNQAVKRNLERFPNDFKFQLTNQEKSELVTNCDRLHNLKHSSVNPYVFTEQGVSMLSSILKSKIAISINIEIMRTFVRLKSQSIPYFDIIKRLETLETDNKETRSLLNKVVHIVSDMQSIQNEANENTKKIGFI